MATGRDDGRSKGKAERDEAQHRYGSAHNSLERSRSDAVAQCGQEVIRNAKAKQSDATIWQAVEKLSRELFGNGAAEKDKAMSRMAMEGQDVAP